MSALGPAISQKNPVLKPGDIDDCWVVSGIQAARGVGGSYTGGGHAIIANSVGLPESVPTIPTYRSKAGRPDVQGQSNGGSADDILKGATLLYPTLRIAKTSQSWSLFRERMFAHPNYLYSVMVVAGQLPLALRYGFTGLHQVTVRYNGAALYIVNPLQVQGDHADQISEAALKRAMLAHDGNVHAVQFAPALPVAAPPPVVEPVPPPVIPVDTTPYSQADIDAAIAADRAKAHIVYE